MNTLKLLFQLDPEITFLNHGSFGACPTAIFNELVQWQKKLENEPVRFITNDLYPALDVSRKALGEFVGCDGNDLVFFPNPSTAINTVAKSLVLNPGDEILSTDHEYGAMNRTWKFICQKTSANFIPVEIPIPVSSHEEFVDRFWSRVTERTRVIFISHLTSQTALIFPVEEICKRARKAGIFTIVDGAHAPGHIPLDISSFDPDIYIGACHKWMCTPKGVSFLYARKSVQDLIDPLVVSWGWESDDPGKSRFLDYHQWQGTRDMSAFLTVPFAIQYLKELNWQTLTKKSHQMVVDFQNEICQMLNTPIICANPHMWQGQMCSFLLPGSPDPVKIQSQLMDNHNIEIPVFSWKDRVILRVSVQPYNSEADLQKLKDILPSCLN